MRFEGRTFEGMEPKTQKEQIAELEALIQRMKDDLAEAREALERNCNAKQSRDKENGA
jgi:hypothetical protein